MIKDMMYYCHSQNTNLNSQENMKLKTFLKAYIGRIIYGSSAYYPILNKSDNFILKSVEIFNKEVE